MPGSGAPGLWLLLVGTAVANSPSMARAGESAVDFNRHIRPILTDNCFACHGFDAKQRRAGLHWTQPRVAMAPRRVVASPSHPLTWIVAKCGNGSTVMIRTRGCLQPNHTRH